MFLNTYMPVAPSPSIEDIGKLFYRHRSGDDHLPVVLTVVRDGVGYYQRADGQNFVEPEISTTYQWLTLRDVGPIIAIGSALLYRRYGIGELITDLESEGFKVLGIEYLSERSWEQMAEQLTRMQELQGANNDHGVSRYRTDIQRFLDNVARVPDHNS